MSQLIKDRLYNHYSTISSYDRLMRKHEIPEARKCLLDQLGISDGQKVLEVAVGTGLNFGNYPNGADFLAIDENLRMLRLARKRSRKLCRPVQFDNQFTHLRISSNFSALVIYMETLNEKKENG